MLSVSRSLVLSMIWVLGATIAPSAQEGPNQIRGGSRRLQEVPEVYVSPALPWKGPIPEVRLELVVAWSLRGEPLGSPSWVDSNTLILATREPETGHDRLLLYRVGNPEAPWTLLTADPVALPPIGGLGKIFVALASGKVRALRAEDGSTAWEISTGERAVSSLALLDGRLLMVQGTTLRVLNAVDGGDLFNLDSGSAPLLPLRNCRGRWFMSLYSGQVQAIDPEDGQVLWKRQVEGLPTPPVCHGKRLMVGTSTHNLVGLKTRSGRHDWTQRLAGAVAVQPLVYAGGVYAGALDGRIYGFKSAGGDRLWAVSVGERVRRQPVLIRSLLGVASGGETRLTFLHLPTGRLILEAEAPGETAGWVGSPAVYGERLAIAADRRDSPDGALVLYELKLVEEKELPGAGEIHTSRALED